MTGDQEKSPQGPWSEAEHARYRALLERHIDGDIAPPDRFELFDHLEECDACREILEAEERLTQRLAQIPRLMAPSALRAQILREALRERQDNLTVTEDERLAPALAGPPAEEEEVESYFEASPAKSRRRRRTAWQRYSPIAATVFLIFASIGALFTWDLPSSNALSTARRHVTDGMRQAGKSFVVALHFYGPKQGVPVKSATDETADAPAAEDDGPVLVDLSVPENVDMRAARQSQALAAWAEERALALGVTVAALADAATVLTNIPDPAEATRAKALAVVLRPTDMDAIAFANVGEELESAIADATENRRQGRIAQRDQFVYAGHRYRCYKLHVSEEWVSAFLAQMNNYRSSRDEEVLGTIEEFGPTSVVANDAVFYSAPSAAIRTAVLHSATSPPGEITDRELDLYIVE